MRREQTNLVDSLAQASMAKGLLERRLVQLGLGVLAALQRGEMSFDEARRELFNTANYVAAKRRRLSAPLLEFLEWGMELEDVAELAAGGLGESYWRMNQIASRIIRHSSQNRRRSA